MNRRPGRQRGASAIEFAIAAPVVLLLGLGALQWALIFHARQAVEYAVIEAARAGSVGHGLPAALDAGLARGLLPFWSTLPAVRAAGGADRTAAIGVAQSHLRQAQSSGWVVIRRLSPTRESFSDWGEPSLDAAGRPVAGSLEIPNDNLMFAEQRAPRGTSSGMYLGLPIGGASGQTLLDANVLKIEVIYGVPMTVPLIGRIAALAGRLLGGCLPVDRGGCLIHEAPDAAGRVVPRWPIATVASVRMQSAARLTADAPPRGSLSPGGGAPGNAGTGNGGTGNTGTGNTGTGNTGTDSGETGSEGTGWGGARTGEMAGDPPGAGEVSPPEAFRPPSGSPGTGYGGVSAGQDGSLARPESGWLSLGGDRLFTVPGACGAP